MNLQVTSSRPLVPSKSCVDDIAEKKIYEALLLKAWGIKGKSDRSVIPTSNPVSLSRERLATIGKHPHLIGLKSDGVRYALFLTLRPGLKDSPIALMIDRANNMYECEVVANEDYFTKGTILEGELVWRQPDETVLLFLIFDVVQCKGISYINVPFVERIKYVEQLTKMSEEISTINDADEMETRTCETDTIVLMSLNPPIIMRPKRFVSLNYTLQVWSDRGSCGHKVDGLVIHRSDAPYKKGTATDAIYKWKPTHTIDLAGTLPNLHALEGPIGKRICGIDVEFISSRVAQSSNAGVAEYLLRKTGETSVSLFALRTRPDKKFANSMKVVESTIQDLFENIQPDELCQDEMSDV